MDYLPKSILFLGNSEASTTEYSETFECLDRISAKCVYEPKNTLEILVADDSDLVILDFELNGKRTFSVVQKLLQTKPNKCIILLADSKNKPYYSEAMKCGVFDFLIKQEISPALLEKSVRYSFNHSKILGKLRESQSKYQDLIEHLPAMFYISNIKPPYSQIYASPSFTQFGYELDEWLGIKNMWSDVLHPDDKDWVLTETDRAMELGEETDYEYRIIGKNGDVFWVHDRGHYYHAVDGKTVYWQGLMNDITDRKIVQEQLLKKLKYDELTGLRNRRSFVEELERVLEETKRNESKRFAVFLMDVDRFKVINDSLGHFVGDKFLVEISQRLEKVVGNDGLVARLSGDEFAILIDDAADISKVENLAQGICNSVATTTEIDDFRFSASASIGITISGDGHQAASNVLKTSDVAMYHAKKSGRNGFRLYDEQLYRDNLRLREIENHLRSALENNEFHLTFQPIVSLETGEIKQVECLLRWHNQRFGNVSPTDFIQIAEENNLIVPIGRWVLEQSCKQLRAWQTEFDSLSSLVVSINISARQLINANFLPEALEILQKYELQPQNLCLEITESSLIENGDHVLEKLKELYKLGFYISTDDFGTGYSSLSYLHRFPFTGLKIDRSFVSDLVKDYRSEKIVKGMINLAHSLDLSVVAEGVETPEQLAKLIELGCDSAQGFYFSRPLPPEFTAELLVEKMQTVFQKNWSIQYSLFNRIATLEQ